MHATIHALPIVNLISLILFYDAFSIDVILTICGVEYKICFIQLRVQHFLKCYIVYGEELLTSPALSWKTIPCWLATTSNLASICMETVYSIRSLRTHALD
jgi:hypothetical protein